MDKKFIFLLTALLGLGALHVYDIFIVHKAIRQVRKEAWFTSQKDQDYRIMNIESCLEYLEQRLDYYPEKHPDYPNGYDIDEEYADLKKKLKEHKKNDPNAPLFDLLLEASL